MKLKNVSRNYNNPYLVTVSKCRNKNKNIMYNNNDIIRSITVKLPRADHINIDVNDLCSEM